VLTQYGKPIARIDPLDEKNSDFVGTPNSEVRGLKNANDTNGPPEVQKIKVQAKPEGFRLCKHGFMVGLCKYGCK